MRAAAEGVQRRVQAERARLATHAQLAAEEAAAEAAAKVCLLGSER